MLVASRSLEQLHQY